MKEPKIINGIECKNVTINGEDTQFYISKDGKLIWNELSNKEISPNDDNKIRICFKGKQYWRVPKSMAKNAWEGENAKPINYKALYEELKPAHDKLLEDYIVLKKAYYEINDIILAQEYEILKLKNK